MQYVVEVERDGKTVRVRASDGSYGVQVGRRVV
jgi:hypothetical protein